MRPYRISETWRKCRGGHWPSVGLHWVIHNGRAMRAPTGLQLIEPVRTNFPKGEFPAHRFRPGCKSPELCGGVQGNQSGSPAASLRLFLLAEERATVTPGGQLKDRSGSGRTHRCAPTGFRKHGENVGAAIGRPWVCTGLSITDAQCAPLQAFFKTNDIKHKFDFLPEIHCFSRGFPV